MINIKNDTIGSKNSRIYLDYQASTPIDSYVLNKMKPYMENHFGNPHSLEHSFGWDANKAVELAREQVASFINALDSEIVFTSGATESNNQAIIGLAFAAIKNKEYQNKRTIIVSAIEHKCILGAARFLEDFGFTIKKAPVDKDGVIKIDKLEQLINNETLLVSIMATNNEIGVNQPLKSIGELCKEKDALFHVDAAQGGYLDLDVVDLNIDFMSLSAHKIYGPKGVGCLYINQNANIKPKAILHGGGQQGGYRSGTIPVFLAVGMGESCNLMIKLREQELKKLKRLRNELINGLEKLIPNITINGSISDRHPGNLNILFPNNFNVRQMLFSLQPHVAISTGSACISGIDEPSHVLKAIGLSTQEAESSCRITVGRLTKLEDIEKLLIFFEQYLKSSTLSL